MEITDIILRKILEGTNIKAIFTIVFNNVFVVHDVKLINGKNGLFVAMPSKKINKGEYKDTAHPIDREFRNYIENAVIKKYKNIVKNF